MGYEDVSDTSFFDQQSMDVAFLQKSKGLNSFRDSA